MTDQFVAINTQQQPPNQLTDITPYFATVNDPAFLNYLDWLNQQDSPPKSYRDHPITCETQLIHFKTSFKKALGLSLGAYLRIKRAYHLLHHAQKHSNDNGNHPYPNQCQFYYITTPIGLMLSVFYHDKLCLLEFIERKMLITELKQLQQEKHCQFVFEQSSLSKKLQYQLDQYFIGDRKHFDIDLDMVGTDFQQQVWQTLEHIDYGTTVSYQEEAEKMGKPTAMRAVANANGKNKIAIIVPCHRVIRKNGQLGGYGGGIERKKYLLSLEQHHC